MENMEGWCCRNNVTRRRGAGRGGLHSVGEIGCWANKNGSSVN